MDPAQVVAAHMKAAQVVAAQEAAAQVVAAVRRVPVEALLQKVAKEPKRLAADPVVQGPQEAARVRAAAQLLSQSPMNQACLSLV